MFCSFIAPRRRRLGRYFPRPNRHQGLGTATLITLLAAGPEKDREDGVVKLAGSACAASSFTCTVDGLDHLVSDDAAARGIAARQGTYAAMCGHVVYVAALVTCAGPLCPRCAQLAQEVRPPVSVPLDRDSGRGRARLARLLGLLTTHSL